MKGSISAIEEIRHTGVKDFIQVKSSDFISLSYLYESTFQEPNQELNNFPVYKFDLEFHERKWDIYKSKEDFRAFVKSISNETNNLLKKRIYRRGINFEQTESPEFLKQLEWFLINICMDSDANHLNSFQKFCQISEVSLHVKNYTIFYQGYLKKQSGGRYRETEGCSNCYNIFKCCKSWRKRWFILTEEFICYILDHHYKDFHETFFFDQKTLLYGYAQTGQEFGILIQNLTRKLLLVANNRLEFCIWVKKIKEALQSNNSIQITSNINGKVTFAPPRLNNKCRFFIDGEQYFEEICNCLNLAEKDVFITGLILCPFLYLKRPISIITEIEESKDDKNEIINRFDQIIENLAKKGVKVYILLYKEVEIACEYQSLFAKNTLEERHSNIKVVRHPSSYFSFWTHHEKILIIDQKIAFIGGIDIAYGRYDTNSHPISDIPDESNKKVMFPGADYCNERISSLTEFDKYYKCRFERFSTPRMPWHDVSIKVEGESVNDLVKHFIFYWNHSKFERLGAQNKHQEDQIFLKNILSEAGEISPNTQNINYNEGNIEELKIPLNRQTTFHSQIPYGKIIGFNRKIDNNINIGEEFKNYVNIEKQKRLYKFKKSINRFFGREESKEAENLHLAEEFVKKKTIQSRKDIKKAEKLSNKIEESEKLYKENIPSFEILKEIKSSGNCKCKVLRSASSWSIGLSEELTETSILDEYIRLIENSKYFIYIENQFFISNTGSNDSNILNKIAMAIFHRIVKAHKEGNKWRLYLILPLLPAYSGQIGTKQSDIMQLLLQLEYDSLFRSDNSLLQSLIKQNIDPQKYILLMGLRQHGLINNVPVTEIIYVHSKLIVVDDEYSIIGSANINDRSMLGDRDSEIALLIEEENKMENNSQENFSKNLRIKLMCEHFGMKENEVLNPLSQDDEFWNTIQLRCQRNTDLYRHIFGCYPDDAISTLLELNNRSEKLNDPSNKFTLKNRYDEASKEILGHVVHFPQHFLEKENLSLSFLQMAYYIPAKNFT